LPRLKTSDIKSLYKTTIVIQIIFSSKRHYGDKSHKVQGPGIDLISYNRLPSSINTMFAYHSYWFCRTIISANTQNNIITNNKIFRRHKISLFGALSHIRQRWFSTSKTLYEHRRNRFGCHGRYLSGFILFALTVQQDAGGCGSDDGLEKKYQRITVGLRGLDTKEHWYNTCR
jgi:hypothetical protein